MQQPASRADIERLARAMERQTRELTLTLGILIAACIVVVAVLAA